MSTQVIKLFVFSAGNPPTDSMQQADVAAVEYIENPTGVCNCDCLFAEIDCLHCLRLHSEIACLHCLRLHSEIDCLYCLRLHSKIACLFVVVTPVVFLLQALHWSTSSLPKDWRRGWKRSPRPWSYGCEASNNDASHQSAASSAAFYFSVVQLVLTCL